MFKYAQLVGKVDGGTAVIEAPAESFDGVELSSAGVARAQALGLIGSDVESRPGELYAGCPGCSCCSCSCSVTGTWGCRNQADADAELGLPGEEALVRAMATLN